MKHIVSIGLVCFCFLVSCNRNETSNNQTTETNIEAEFDCLGTFVWEGEVELGYGVKSFQILTMEMIDDGTVQGKEFTKETNETIRWELQWFRGETGEVVFGKFSDAQPNENSKGVQFIGYPDGQDLIVGVNKNRYKKLK